jgi:hypothetical protein
MPTAPEFDDLRPYRDEEINPALHRITSVPEFARILEFFFPDRNKDEIVAELRGIHSAAGFQKVFMHPLVSSIVGKTSAGLTYSGFSQIAPGTPCLFVANHRDIVLDSAILQVLLLDNQHETSEITFGSNLMINEFIVDFGKVNRMFKVYRGGNRMEFFRNSQLLSSYLRHTLTEKKTSAWIAQRSGRTKDGIDKTETGLLKMFNMSGKADFEQNFAELNLVPLSISYEYEPCCALKVREMASVAQGIPYRKEADEDFRSIILGITQPKGRIHLAVCKPVNEFLAQTRGTSVINDKINLLATLIDKEIYRNYRLWPTHYIAADMLEGKPDCSGFYTPDEKDAFVAYMERELAGLQIDTPEHRRIFLEIYANPIRNVASVL